MKNFVKLFLTSLSLLGGVVIFNSCSNALDEDLEVVQGNQRTAYITTRSGAVSLDYPLTLYAFRTSDGSLIQSFTATSAEDDPQVILTEGSYKLVAMAGYGDLLLPEIPSLQASMGIPDNGIMNEALQVGRANVIIGKQDAEVEINMSYQVAQVNLSLQDIPEDVTAVSVSLSTMYKDLTFDGTLSNNQTVTLDLVKQGGGIWSAPVAYVLPGQSTQLTLSINMTDATSTKTYGYTHTTNLKAGTPYAMTGSYKGTFTVGGIISGAGWASTENIGFTFGPGAGEDNTDSEITEDPEDTGDDNSENTETGNENVSDETDGTYTVTSLPQVKSIWEGHFIAQKVSADATSAELLLLSLEEWEIKNAEVAGIAETYTENGMSDWRIATETEMSTLSNKLGNAAVINSVNNTLISAGGETLTSSGEYLCADAAKYVKMGNTNVMSTQPTDTYKLRLVKTVHVKLAQ